MDEWAHQHEEAGHGWRQPTGRDGQDLFQLPIQPAGRGRWRPSKNHLHPSASLNRHQTGQGPGIRRWSLGCAPHAQDSGVLEVRNPIFIGRVCRFVNVAESRNSVGELVLATRKLNDEDVEHRKSKQLAHQWPGRVLGTHMPVKRVVIRANGEMHSHNVRS